MIFPNGAVRFLASVRNVEEARCVVQCGGDIIDCKAPERGALGALDTKSIAAIRQVVPDDIPLSATLGDDALLSGDLAQRIRDAEFAGVDFVKIGLDVHGPWRRAVSEIATLRSSKCGLVGVVLVDRGYDLDMVGACRDAGFAGVMFDTAEKDSSALPDLVAPGVIQNFISDAHDAAMFAGLAGALRAEHVASLAALGPDILGFRGALCHNNERQGAIDPSSVCALRALIGAASLGHDTKSTGKVCAS